MNWSEVEGNWKEVKGKAKQAWGHLTDDDLEAAAQPAVPADTGPVVFAAASMKTALDAVAAAWKANRGKTASIVYASSAVLAKQIEPMDGLSRKSQVHPCRNAAQSLRK